MDAKELKQLTITLKQLRLLKKNGNNSVKLLKKIELCLLGILEYLGPKQSV